MISVGIKELKAKLSSYLEKARQGEEFLVTDRGKDIALVIPISPERRTVSQLIETGKASWKGGKPSGVKGIRAKGRSIAKTILEDRR